MKNQFVLDKKVTLVNVDRKWYAVTKDIGELIGYAKPSVAFNKFCSKSEVLVENIQYPDQKRATQLVTGLGILELLGATAMDIEENRLKWICKRLIKTLKAFNGECTHDEVIRAKRDCSNKIIRELIDRNKELDNKIKSVNDMEKVIESKKCDIENLKIELNRTIKKKRDIELELLYINDIKGNLEARNKTLRNLISKNKLEVKNLDKNLIELSHRNEQLNEELELLKFDRCVFCKIKNKLTSSIV